MTITSGISPCLWFDDDLEEAARFYTGIFPNSSIGHLARYNAASPGESSKVMAGASGECEQAGARTLLSAAICDP